MTNALNKMGWLLAALVSAAALAALAGLVSAGPLDPPGPPTTGTMKTLEEVEPRTPISSLPYSITSPGSYYLTGNLVGPAGVGNGITITTSDVTLDLNGFALVGVPGSLTGVTSGATPIYNISITNGTVRDWAAAGVNLPAFNSQVDGLKAYNNGGQGILLQGAGNTLTDCIASSNGGGAGIGVGPSSTIIGCVAKDNAGMGIYAPQSVVRDCVSQGNAGAGIEAWYRSIVEGCTVSGNGRDGIYITEGSLVKGNIAAANGLAGIPSFQAGIHATGINNRVEDNTVSAQVRGIQVDAASSVIIKNDAGSNVTNYTIAAGNTVGPIVAGPVDPIASTNPWANFSQ